MRLTAENVDATLSKCFYSESEARAYEGEVPPDAVLVTGITMNLALQPDRVASVREDVRSMLSELDDKFMVGGGGGASFLEACYTREGAQWGGHRSMQGLFCLGMATGLAVESGPVEMRPMLPGGVPYYTVDLSK